MKTYTISIRVTIWPEDEHDEYHEWKNERDAIVRASEILGAIDVYTKYSYEMNRISIEEDKDEA